MLVRRLKLGVGEKDGIEWAPDTPGFGVRQTEVSF